MNKRIEDLKLSGIIPLEQDYGENIEYRCKDGWSWYDLESNHNSIPCETDTAIIVTAWMGHLKFLRATLTSYRKSGAFVILAYNNPFYAWSSRDPIEIHRNLPNVGHLLLANCFVMKHITYDCDKRNGTFWNARYGKGVISQFPNIKYVYVTNGDCIWEKPDGLRAVKDLLGDGDLMAGQSDNNLMHTAAVLYKREAFDRISDHMYQMMRVPVIGSNSPEILLREAVDELKLKHVPAPKQPIYPQDGTVDMYCCYNQDSTWKELLGFRNLFSELECAWEEGLEPLPKKYVDDYMDLIYFSGEERETLCQYYKTGDRRHLLRWWDYGEDSWFNRLYYPLEHYGTEPIYAL